MLEEKRNSTVLRQFKFGELRKSGVVRKRRMEQKSKNGVSIIGGADGPTSIFIAGPSEKQPLKVSNWIQLAFCIYGEVCLLG